MYSGASCFQEARSWTRKVRFGCLWAACASSAADQNKQTEKILDLSPVQLTVSNSSQTSVDSVSLFVSDLSQAVSMLDSVIGVRSGVGTVHVS